MCYQLLSVAGLAGVWIAHSCARSCRFAGNQASMDLTSGGKATGRQLVSTTIDGSMTSVTGSHVRR